ncbi:MAG: hypothetical protein BWX54_01840 [Verrucomicrobia bacterium ADurb.Bin018]|nr:MAG: hypothetical protein BWX54_01840 [Verrucomicrobia bacterium ADurb.Bin018]
MRVGQHNVFTIGADAKTGVQIVAVGDRPTVFVRRKHNQIFMRLDAHLAKYPFERLLGAVRQPPPRQRDGRIGGVVELDPVRRVAVFVFNGQPVGGLHFIDVNPADGRHQNLTHNHGVGVGIRRHKTYFLERRARARNHLFVHPLKYPVYAGDSSRQPGVGQPVAPRQRAGRGPREDFRRFPIVGMLNQQVVVKRLARLGVIPLPGHEKRQRVGRAGDGHIVAI